MAHAILGKPIHHIAKLTDIGEKNRQENEPVSGSEQDNAQVHAEVEDLENLTLREAQHENTAEFGERNA